MTYGCSCIGVASVVHVGEEGGSRYLEIDQRSKVWYYYAGTIIGIARS